MRKKSVSSLLSFYLFFCQKKPTLILTNLQPSARPYGGSKLWSAATKTSWCLHQSCPFSDLEKTASRCVSTNQRQRFGWKGQWDAELGAVKAAVALPTGVTGANKHLYTHAHTHTHTSPCKSIHNPYIYSNFIFRQPQISGYVAGLYEVTNREMEGKGNVVFYK